MRRYLLLLWVVTLAMWAGARDQWTLDGKTYDVDTLIYPHPVGPGVEFAKYDLPLMPLKVSVMTLDLTNPYIELESWLGSERSVGCETPTSVVARQRAAGREVVGATNGDFYRTSPSDQVGVPTSGQVTNGQVMVAPTGRASFALDENHRPYIDRIDFTASYTHAGATTAIGKMNNPENSGENRTILFTRAYGPSTYTCASGKLVLLAPQSEPFAWHHTGTEHCVVEQVIDATGGAIAIPDGKAYLWMQGSHVSKAQAMQPGDVVDIKFKVSLRQWPDREIAFKEMVGGSDHLIMRDGVFREDWAERHPRTCIGMSADSTRVFFVVIDGRWAESVGVTLKEAYGIFQALGAAHAVNLDGGGSSCMVVGDEVVNHPSDGSVRAVGNGFVLYATSPQDDDIGMLHFEPRCYNVSISAQLRFAVWGYNRYGVLKTRDQQGCTFSCDPQVGRFTPEGMFIASATPAVGKIYATLGDSIVTEQTVSIVNAIKMLRCDSVVIDRYHPYPIEVLGISGYNNDLVDPTIMQWTVDDPGVCRIDENCVLHAVADGRTTITGTGENFYDIMVVRVENPKDSVTTVENAPIDPATWSVTQSGGKNREVTALDNGVRITFTGSSSRNPYVRLSKRVQLWGLPRAIRVRVRPGDLSLGRATFSMSQNTGSQLLNYVEEPTVDGDELTYTLPTDQWCDASDQGIYPLGLVYINLAMASPTAGQTYTLDIPGIELLYDVPGDSYHPCDVDHDGQVDIKDVNAVINAMLGKASSTDLQATCDVDGNGEIDISDVNAIINTMLGKV